MATARGRERERVSEVSGGGSEPGRYPVQKKARWSGARPGAIRGRAASAVRRRPRGVRRPGQGGCANSRAPPVSVSGRREKGENEKCVSSPPIIRHFDTFRAQIWKRGNWMKCCTLQAIQLCKKVQPPNQFANMI